MRAALRAELFKLRTIRTGYWLFAAMSGLILFVVLLHGFGLAAERFDSASRQITMLFGWGGMLGVVFAALLGAMSFTSEVRSGTIRPTLLVTPNRGRVVLAKFWASMTIGAVFGLVAGVLTSIAGVATLQARGIDVKLNASDYALLIGGGTVTAALLAGIGVGVGAVVRNQVPALVGICAWLLFVENVLLADLGLASDIGRLLPGAAARALTGQDPDTFVAPGAGLILLILYATVAAFAGCLATSRRDVD